MCEIHPWSCEGDGRWFILLLLMISQADRSSSDLHFFFYIFSRPSDMVFFFKIACIYLFLCVCVDPLIFL